MGKLVGALMKGRSGLPAGQLQVELDWLIALFRREGVKSYLEIGARSGDTFYEITRSLPPGAKAVAVDLAGSLWGYGGSDVALRYNVADLCQHGYDARLIIGNSHEANTRGDVDRHAPFDAVLIDGDHTLIGARQDWLDYGAMGKIVAFHDIAWHREQFPGTRIEVPLLWGELKVGRRHEQIITEPCDCGIGVLWN